MCTLQERRMVVPSGLHRSPFTSGAVDNIDSNPPSFIAKGSFHGTARYYSRIQTLKAIGEGEGGGGKPIDLHAEKTPQQHLPDYFIKVSSITTPHRAIKVPAATAPL